MWHRAMALVNWRRPASSFKVDREEKRRAFIQSGGYSRRLCGILDMHKQSGRFGEGVDA